MSDEPLVSELPAWVRWGLSSLQTPTRPRLMRSVVVLAAGGAGLLLLAGWRWSAFAVALGVAYLFHALWELAILC